MKTICMRGKSVHFVRQMRAKASFFAGMLATSVLAMLPSNAQAAPGVLDTSFGTAGKVTTADAGSLMNGDMIVQPDDRIIIATNKGTNLLLVRYLPGGALDSSFGTGGFAQPEGIYHWYGEWTLALQGDGKILAAGSDSENGAESPVLIRFTSNGILDRTFGDGGIARGTLHGQWTTVGAQSDGKILVAGAGLQDKSVRSHIVSRYNSNGTLDTTFANGGTNFKAVHYPTESPRGVIQPDGKAIAVSLMNFYLGISRFNKDGTSDATFGDQGLATPDADYYAYEIPTSIAATNNGKIYITWSPASAPSSASYFRLARFNSNGSVDTTFGTTIPIQTTFFGYSAIAQDIVCENDGHVLVAGTSSYSNGSIVLARYDVNGNLDESFGIGGKAALAVPHLNDVVMAQQSTGKIVTACGFRPDGSSPPTLIALARFGGGQMAPTISSLNNLVTNEDTAAQFTFRVTDDSTAPGGISVSFDSSDKNVLQSANIVENINPTDPGSRTATLTPVANRSGETAITVTARDAQGAITTRKFVLTVRPVNDAPLVTTPADVVITSPTSLIITVSGLDEGGGSMEGHQNLTLSATSSAPSVVVPSVQTYKEESPTANLSLLPKARGTATITLTVKDDGGNTNGGVNTTSVTFKVTVSLPGPSISSFTPAATPSGSPLTLLGTNFTGATQVTVGANNKPQTFSVVSAGRISIPALAAGTQSGPVRVITPGGLAISATNFQLLPKINTFSPTAGPVGSVITLAGTDFKMPVTGAPNVAIVAFTSGPGTFIPATDFKVLSPTSITVRIPEGAVNGPIRLQNASGFTQSSTAFTVTKIPSLVSLTPSAAKVGASVLVNGYNLDTVQNFDFMDSNRIPQSAVFSIVNSKQLRVIVPKTAATNTLIARNGAGQSQPSPLFIVIPDPRGISPASGAPGVLVTIIGTGFAGLMDVTFNNVSAGPQQANGSIPATGWSLRNSTTIMVRVPMGASTGRIALQYPLGLVPGPGIPNAYSLSPKDFVVTSPAKMSIQLARVEN